ncbi:FMN-binding glutamate synthase family protein [Bacillus velezensis]|uniref:FMN-binding glutamate synthase family protein n=1 Tax=Bacillus velezensis TaxID=492670 RepID=UPI0008631ADD|nr:FMN-binding glutamate synthase family protein [Bacillus velezensis]AOU00159.1 FMN-binding glutamate synthase family protein [Bacillus velezensis]
MEQAIIVLICVLIFIILVPAALFLWIYIRDEKQEEHSVLRNYPAAGKLRYIFEKIGPELRQYLFSNDNEEQPFSRREYEQTVMSGKYKSRMMGFGSERDFDQPGYYIRNALFPKQREELRTDQTPKIDTMVYKIDKDNLLKRSEHREKAKADPYYLHPDDVQVIGRDTCKKPFYVKGLIGQSAMSYGSLGDRAITALSKGLHQAGGTWMNTGEGGLSEYHLKGGADIICQIGPGLFGVRTEDGEFSWEEFKKKSRLEQIKAFELKLAQGAKARGGHIDGSKVTEEIAAIRNVQPGQSIDSPNRFNEFSNVPDMLDFIEKLRTVGEKPVGIKIVPGSRKDLEDLISCMSSSGKLADFITIDGSEGGTGASFHELADSVGLPILTGLPLVDGLLKTYGIRDKLKIFASGKLLTPDKIAVALALGADFVNIARGMMFSVGCIRAQVCHTNHCPVGVATTDPKLQRALSIEDKQHRVCNYVLSLREGLFHLAAAAGISSPIHFSAEHIVYREEDGSLRELSGLLNQHA